MYAKRKNIPLSYSDVKITITNEGTSNEILREINFIGTALTEADKQALMVIADKCPIHKFLTAGAKITSKLV
jgi:putative redox protein